MRITTEQRCCLLAAMSIGLTSVSAARKQEPGIVLTKDGET